MKEKLSTNIWLLILCSARNHQSWVQKKKDSSLVSSKTSHSELTYYRLFVLTFLLWIYWDYIYQQKAVSGKHNPQADAVILLYLLIIQNKLGCFGGMGWSILFDWFSQIYVLDNFQILKHCFSELLRAEHCSTGNSFGPMFIIFLEVKQIMYQKAFQSSNLWTRPPVIIRVIYYFLTNKKNRITGKISCCHVTVKSNWCSSTSISFLANNCHFCRHMHEPQFCNIFKVLYRLRST